MQKDEIDPELVLAARDELLDFVLTWREKYHPQVVIAAIHHVLALLIAAAPGPYRSLTLNAVLAMLPDNVEHEVNELAKIQEAADGRRH